MNEKDIAAFESWAHKNGYADIEYKHKGMPIGRYYNEIAYDAWEAALEYRDGQQADTIAWKKQHQVMANILGIDTTPPAAQPVRLTYEEVKAIAQRDEIREQQSFGPPYFRWAIFANAIMDAMQAKAPAAQPVRLTYEEIGEVTKNIRGIHCRLVDEIANAIMDAMQAKNGGAA